MVSKLCTDAIRDTYILMLIKNFIEVGFLAKFEEIPKKITDDSIDYIVDSNVVLGYIMDKYDVTANTDDKVAAGALLSKFTKESGSKMVAGTFKTDMQGISGITWQRATNGNFYYGLVERKEEVKYVPDND